MKVLSRYTLLGYYRSSSSLQLCGLVQCFKQVAFVRFSSARRPVDDRPLPSVLSGEKQSETLEGLFEERVKCDDLGSNEDNLAYCLELVDIWLQNSVLEKADWAIQLIEDHALKFGLPYNVQVLQYLAKLRFKQSRFQDSANTLHRIKAIGLEHPGTFINLGIVYSAMENYDQAAFSFEKAATMRNLGSNSGPFKRPNDLHKKSDLEDLLPMYSPDRYHFHISKKIEHGNQKVCDPRRDVVLRQVRDQDETERRYREAYNMMGRAVDS